MQIADEIRFARKRGFFQSYRPWGLDISSASKLVYLYLNDRGGSNDRAWPKVKTIAEETGLSERSVRYATAELSQKGLVVKKARFKNKKQTSNMYLIFPPDQPFRPEVEYIDDQGNVAPKQTQDIALQNMQAQNIATQNIQTQDVALQNMQAQDIALQNMQGGPANIAGQEIYSLEHVVVVDGNHPPDENAGPEKQTAAQPGGQAIATSTATEPDEQNARTTRLRAAFKDATGNDLPREAAEQVIKQWPASYIREKIEVCRRSRITESVVGFFIRALEEDYPLPEPKNNQRAKTGRTPKPKRTDEPDKEKKKALIRSLYAN